MQEITADTDIAYIAQEDRPNILSQRQAGMQRSDEAACDLKTRWD